MKTRNAIGIFLIGTGLFCAAAEATICPPCPPNICCRAVPWPVCWEGCDADNCESCVFGSCLECGGYPNQVCCGTTIPNYRECCTELNCWRCQGDQCKYICDTNHVCCANDCCPHGQPCCDNITCYDPNTYHCCDYENGKICENDETCCADDCCDNETEICCNGVCCDKATKCCVNGECKDPICDNCHCYDRTLDECLHLTTDQNGTPCSMILCIHNELSSATCDYHSENAVSCSRCTAEVQPTGTACWQTIYAYPCPGGVVDWHTFATFYVGCPLCLPATYRDSCLTDSCTEGEPVGEPLERGDLWDCTGTCQEG